MKFLITVLALAVSGVASAASTNRIVSIDAFDLAYTGGIVFKNDSGHSPSRSETTFRLNLNYAQNWDQYVGLMWKARAFINREDVSWGNNDSFNSRWGAAGGVLYNYNADDVKNSIFAGAMGGIERQTIELGNSKDKSGFNLFVDFEGGKRWDLGSYSTANISYAPSVSVSFKRYGGAIRDDYFMRGSEFKINFLKFDILF